MTKCWSMHLTEIMHSAGNACIILQLSTWFGQIWANDCCASKHADLDAARYSDDTAWSGARTRELDESSLTALLV
jgi:hypothetical protein